MSPASSPLHFGSFDLDLHSGELWKNGLKVRLGDQPFQVLAMLLDHPGQVVTREELRQRLWSANTFVDFEQSLNAAVKRLREALCDSADNPRYIETIPRHGYRWIASIGTSNREAREPIANRVMTAAETAAHKPWKWRALAMILLAAGLLALGNLFLLSRRVRALTPLDTIVVADFDNKTGDAVFDDALKQALIVELEQSPFLNMLSDRRIGDILRQMGHAAGERLAMDLGREVCVRTGSKAVLGGTISSLGSHYVINLNAIACNTGDMLAKEQGEAASKEDVLKILHRLSSNLRKKLGESLASVEQYDVPAEVTTSSLEALRAYSMAVKILRQKGSASAIPFLRRAIELDSNFPLAYAVLAAVYGNLGQSLQSIDCAAKAYQLRDRASEREKLRLSAMYFGVRGSLGNYVQALEIWKTTYPNDATAHNNLGVVYASLGQYDKAVAEYKEALRVYPFVVAYSNLGGTYVSLGRLDEAQAVFDETLALSMDSGGLRRQMYLLAFLREDSAQMAQHVAWGTGKTAEEDVLLSMESDTQAYYGRMRVARDFTRRAVDAAIRAESKETAALWHANAALREAEVGNARLTNEDVAGALSRSPAPGVKLLSAVALARIGEVARAQQLARELEKGFPTDTLLNSYWIPTLHAVIELNRKNPSQALAHLQSVGPYEIGSLNQPPTQLVPLYAAYVRGQAYLLLHNGAAAITEFEKIRDHRSIVLNCLIGSLVHLQLARAYAMAGETSKSRASYQVFFALWEGADDDIPILKQAEAEFTNLSVPEQR